MTLNLLQTETAPFEAEWSGSNSTDQETLERLKASLLFEIRRVAPKLSESFTAQQESISQTRYSDERYNQFLSLFRAAKELTFEDGMHTEFSRSLLAMVKEYGDQAIEVLEDLIIGNQVGIEEASEALRWLGQLEDASTHFRRLNLLGLSLGHSSARIRDGAILGLSFMDDPSAIPYIRAAIERETTRPLREDMRQVLAQLET